MDTEVNGKVVKRTHNFCFTDFVLEDSFWANFSNKYDAYVNYGREICPSTGREHFQGFIHFKNAHNLESLRKICKPRSIRACIGSMSQNLVYTDKDQTNITELGDRPRQGKRTDLTKIKNEILNGKKVDDIAIENPMSYHQYGRTFNKIEDIAMRKKFRVEMTKGTWYFGPTGVGKSHKAYENFSPETHYVLNINDKGWWEGYAQQETVIINEFRGQITFSDLLDLVDKWPKSVPRRGREPMPFTSKHVIITSSMRPEDVFRNKKDSDSWDQLYRRFNIYKCHGMDIFEKIEARKCSEGNTDFLAEFLEDDD